MSLTRIAASNKSTTQRSTAQHSATTTAAAGELGGTHRQHCNEDACYKQSLSEAQCAGGGVTEQVRVRRPRLVCSHQGSCRPLTDRSCCAPVQTHGARGGISKQGNCVQSAAAAFTAPTRVRSHANLALSLPAPSP
jgi:hypothetical protein